MKNSLIIASYVLLVAIFFAGGYAFGNYKIEGVVQSTEAPRPVEAVSAANISEAEEVTVYTVIMENGVLKLYSVTDGEKTQIAGQKISENIFPKQDIEMLKNGVTTDNLGDAQELFENFVS
jgi:hypothetical protein